MPTSPVSLTKLNGIQERRAYTEPADKNPDKIRISGFGVKKVAENPDFPKWNGYMQTLTVISPFPSPLLSSASIYILWSK